MEIAVVILLGAVLNGMLASSRGRSPIIWAFIGALAPLISLLILVLMQNLKEEDTTKYRIATAEAARAEAEHQRRLAEIKTAELSVASTKVCPRCAETVKKAALVCRYCGHEFSGEHDSPAAHISQQSLTNSAGSPMAPGQASDAPVQSISEYKGHKFNIHSDMSVSSVINGHTMGWQSVFDFRNWIDAWKVNN